MLCLFNWLKDRGPRFRRKPFKLLACSPTSRIGNRMEGRGEKEEEITIKRFRLSFHSGFVECWGSDYESLAEIFTTNFAQQFEPDGPRSGRSINDQTLRKRRGIVTWTRDDFKVHSHEWWHWKRISFSTIAIEHSNKFNWFRWSLNYSFVNICI